MRKISPLLPGQIYGKDSKIKIPWSDSSQIPLPPKNRPYANPFQPRAMAALDLAFAIPDQNYHVFMCGEPGSGREFLLKSWLESRTHKRQTPPDLIYLQNFISEDNPILLSLNAGQGKSLAKLFREFLDDLQNIMGEKLLSSVYFQKKESLHRDYQEMRLNLLNKLSRAAKKDSLDLRIGEDGEITLIPLLAPEKLSSSENDIPVKEKNEPSNSLYKLIHELEKLESSYCENLQNLEKKEIAGKLEKICKTFAGKIKKSFSNSRLLDYIDELSSDIEKNYPYFFLADMQKDTGGQKTFFPVTNMAQRYGINLFVDNSMVNGAPIIWEGNPSFANLLGCFERESEMGAFVTNFSLIKAGSLHRANGGFLIIHLNDLFEKPGAFENLLRILKSGTHKMEDINELGDNGIHPKSIQPEAIKLNLTVILIGSEEDYEYLFASNERFAKLFRIKAHMATEIEKSSTNVRQFLIQIAQIIRNANLLTFTDMALGKICEIASWLAEDRQKLSLNFSALKDYLLEASAVARQKQMDMVTGDIMDEVWQRKVNRHDLLEKLFLEDYTREIVKLQTSSRAIGKINALSVIQNGDFEFGLPHTISCAIGVGHDGIIDLERDAEMSGPIHNKAMMILKSYLTARFANKNPIVLTGSLYFEQNYSDIEGDSASAAELAVIISAIAKVPLRQDLAISGSVNQDGEILAVGGISAKVEGFYKLCKMRGLSGTQGVIIPKDNLAHLFLSQALQNDMEKGIFSIYAIQNIEDALILLTGMSIGKMRKNYTYTPGSLFARVDERLVELGYACQHPFRGAKKTH